VEVTGRAENYVGRNLIPDIVFCSLFNDGFLVTERGRGLIKELSRHLPEGTEKDYETSGRISGLRAEI
jgi:hypothetical protein